MFTNFIDDDADYRFADIKIATCDEANWSYPDWPNPIDQLLITNELFDKVKPMCARPSSATATDRLKLR